jgi:autotransporter-associated beta strand protein
VRWEGQVEAPSSAIHTFHVLANDGALLWVDDQLLVGRTAAAATAIEMAGSIRLEAGRRYNLRLEFIEGTGDAIIRLSWSSPTQPKQIIPTDRLLPAAESPERGSILLEHWTDLPGANLDALTTAPAYPSRPTGRDPLIRFEGLAPNTGDHYGQRVIGYLVPAASGNYTFAVAAADTAELWLSSDATAANKARLVRVAAATAERNFANTSTPVPLVQGQKYYVELLHKAGAGPDHFSVAWRPPGRATFEVIEADSLIPANLGRTPPGQGNYLATLATGHPRIFISPPRVEWLRQQLAAGAHATLTAWFNSLKSSADSLRTQPVNTYALDNRNTLLTISRSVYDRTYKLALAWLMTGDSTYAERLYAELEKAANPTGGRAPDDFPNWNPSHFLDVAEMTHAFAVAYDWLYSYWTPARRDVLRQAIVARGLTAGLQEFTRNTFWTQPSSNNWTLVCTGGLTLGALAIAGENAADTTLVEQILHNCVTKVAPLMAHYTTDNGGWYEGPGYWDFATEYNIRMLAALEGALGSDFGLSAIPGLALTGYYPPYMVGPTRQSFNFADAGSGNVAGSQLFWLARRFNLPDYAWHQRTNGGAEALGLFWFDGRGQDPVTGGLPLDNWFRGATGATSYATQDIVTLRSQWMDSRATFLAAKAGEVGASHGNLDAGTFVLDALGQRWATELGADDYALPGYFSEPQRWTYYRLRAEGQNTLVINPGSGVDQVLRARPAVTLFATEPNAERGAVAMDLTAAYPGATRVHRGFQLFNRRRHVLIQDEIVYPTAARVWWFMHYGTDKTVTIDPDGTSATMSKGADRLWLKILAGGGRFSVMDATPLPTSPNPAGQNANATIKKLAISLPAVTQTTLAVYAVPLLAGETPPATLPAIIALADWPMTGTAPAVNNWTAADASTPLVWSNAAYWSAAGVPASGRGATLDFFTGSVLPAGQFTLQNDLPAGLAANALVLGGTSTGTARVRLTGNPLTLAAHGAVKALVRLTATGSGLSYEVAQPIVLGDPTTFEVAGSAAFRFSGPLSGPAGLIHAGGTLVLTGANTYSGTTVIGSGTLQIGDDGATGTLGAGPVVNHGTLRFDRTGTLAVPNDISGAGGLDIDCPINAGTIVLSGRNTFSGGINVRSGAIRITHGGALGAGPKSILLSNGTAGGPQLLLDSSGSSITVPAAIGFTTSNTNGAVVNEAGHNTLEGDFTLTGGGGNTKIIVNAGRLTLNGNLAPNTTSRNLDLGGVGDGIVNGAITDGGGANVLGVIKSGPGSWTLNGANAWTGNTAISAGTLLINGRITGPGPVTAASGATLGGTGTIAGPVTIQAGARLAPGASLGTLTINNTLTLSSASTTAMEVNAQSGASDRVAGLTRATYAGTLTVTNLAGQPAVGQSFVLFAAAAAGGNFSLITPAPGAGLGWSFDPATGRLSVVASSATPATINTQPQTLTAPSGSGVTLSVAASGTGPIIYQWLKNGAVIPGATRDTYTLAAVRASDAGSYSVVVTNSVHSLTSNTATLTVAGSRLGNLSILTSIEAPGDSFTMGYVVGGTGTSGAKPLVIRAAGPSLEALGVSGTLPDPRIELFAGANWVGENDNWGGAASVANAMAAVGAFAYMGPASRDAALALSVTNGDNSVKVSGVGGSTGTVIAEIYDATPTADFTTTTPRLVNVSVLKPLGPGFTAGFVVVGSGTTNMLVRAIGPTLGTAFGVSGVVSDPQLALFSGPAVVASNDNWGGGTTLAAAFSAVGAFALPATSRDAAVLASLGPGNYTVQVSGAAGATGVILVEIYELP